MIALAAMLAFVLRRTRYGRYVRAVGSNARVARYSAIDVDRTRLIAYTLTGLLVGVSAVLIAMRFNSVGTSTLGVNYELDAIAAVIIGGTSMAGGRGTIWGTIVGAITLGRHQQHAQHGRHLAVPAGHGEGAGHHRRRVHPAPAAVAGRAPGEPARGQQDQEAAPAPEGGALDRRQR